MDKCSFVKFVLRWGPCPPGWPYGVPFVLPCGILCKNHRPVPVTTTGINGNSNIPDTIGHTLKHTGDLSYADTYILII